ncbi:MAG TPA: transketolase C-terminal domain-containing protein, partial [Anaeromyxobacteraceae bacterium]|nr:transketolase C-terminal domain-containing protein [Anaeromyxobacteraceae bacterium]
MSAHSYEEALEHVARGRPEVMVLTAENRLAIRGLAEKLGPRFVDVGICEQTLVGTAAGLALRGRIPVVHAIAAFLTMRAFEFIRTDVGIAGLPVKLVGGVPGFLSEENGPTHQAIEDVALMRLVPGMEIFCPADEEELVAGLPLAIASPSPVYIRYNSRPATRQSRELVFGKAEVVGGGRDFALLSYGLMVREGLVALAELEARGIFGRLVNLRTLAPIDSQAIERAARETPLVVTLEDHLLTGGLF